MIVSSERPDHSWSLAIRTRGGVESNVGIAPSVQEAAYAFARIAAADETMAASVSAGPARGSCMLHAADAEKITHCNRYRCITPSVTIAEEVAAASQQQRGSPATGPGFALSHRRTVTCVTRCGRWTSR